MSIKDVLRDARLPEKTVDVCLRGDLVADYDKLEAEHAKAVENRGNSLNSGAEAADIKQRMDALKPRIAEASVTFRLRALTRPAWRKLGEEHPPRKDGDDIDERDQYVGLNIDTFFEALVRASVIEPQLDEEDWSLLLDERLTDRQFALLSDAAWGLNRRDVDVPFSLDGLRTQHSEPK